MKINGIFKKTAITALSLVTACLCAFAIGGCNKKKPAKQPFLHRKRGNPSDAEGMNYQCKDDIQKSPHRRIKKAYSPHKIDFSFRIIPPLYV